METLEVTYRISADSAAPEALVESVLLEQTIETPRSVAERYPFVEEHMMGSVRELRPEESGDVIATLSLPFSNAAADPAQFLNVLFGNSSLHPHVTLLDFHPPSTVTRLLPGPSFGMEGIRQTTGVTGRPLTCSALKPVGLSVQELSDICRTLAESGIDLIKDDHYLADQSFSPFRERVRICQEVVDDVSSATGRRVVYVPNLSGGPDDIRRQAAYVQEQGVRAVMIAPMLVGLPTLHATCRDDLDVPVLAHPSFGGISAIRPSVLFGKLFRLYGADAVIFANYGGRFSYDAALCAEIAQQLRSAWLGIKPSFPIPAGGMDADRVSELVQFFGLDSILLIGGSLLEAGDDLDSKARRFVETVHSSATTLQNAF